MSLEDLLELMHLARAQFAAVEARLRLSTWSEVMHPQGLRRVLAESVDHIWFKTPNEWMVRIEEGLGAGLMCTQDSTWTPPELLDEAGHSAGGLDGLRIHRQAMWEPNILIPEIWLEPIGLVKLADREGIHAMGRPRPTSHDFLLIPKGDLYDLVFDVERGILLRFEVDINGQEVLPDEVLSIKFDDSLRNH
jgi:hypothetical protein